MRLVASRQDTYKSYRGNFAGLKWNVYFHPSAFSFSYQEEVYLSWLSNSYDLYLTDVVIIATVDIFLTVISKLRTVAHHSDYNRIIC